MIFKVLIKLAIVYLFINIYNRSKKNISNSNIIAAKKVRD